MNEIHSTAIVSDSVQIGTGNVIGPYAVISGDAKIGDNNWIGTGVVIGSPPEIKGSPHQAISSNEDLPRVIIGDNNYFREGVSVQGSLTGKTQIGSNCFIMTRAYIAHDCEVQDEVIMAANSSVAGHCIIETFANIGLSAAVHQRIVVGRGAMVGMNSTVTKNVVAFTKTYGSPAKIRGTNVFVLKKMGANDLEIKEINDFINSNLDEINFNLAPKAYLKYVSGE